MGKADCGQIYAHKLTQSSALYNFWGDLKQKTLS